METLMFKTWLAAALEKSKMTQTQLAAELTKRLGRSIDKAAVNKMVSGKRKISADELVQIADLTGVPAPSTNDTVVPVTLEVTGLPLLGHIEAGSWRETRLIDREAEPEMLPLARDPRFPRARQYVLMVVGDSMNLEYPEGSYVTCVDFHEAGIPMKDGLIVHVERYRYAGQEVEVTLKELKRTNKGWLLSPRSTNPLHKPVEIDDGNGAEVHIKGIVTGSWRRTEI